MRYGYPVFLDLQDQPCIVFGGNVMAEEKARGLIEAGARLTVVSAELDPGFGPLIASGHCQWIARDYQTGDLRGCFLAVSAGDRQNNAAIWAEGQRENVIVNCLDDPPHCRYIYPSIHRQGELVVALSTTGKCPALAVRLRQRLAEQLGPEYATFLEVVSQFRDRLAALVPDFATRKAIWYQLVDSSAIDLIRRGNRPQAEAELETIIRQATPKKSSS
jgi:siroheme synthase-like protein